MWIEFVSDDQNIAFEFYLKFFKLGEKCHVLVTETSHDGNYYVAHNKYYEQVLVPKIDIYMGKMIEVEIIECTKFSMKGRVLQEVFDSPRRPVEYKLGEVTGVSKVRILKWILLIKLSWNFNKNILLLKGYKQ